MRKVSSIVVIFVLVFSLLPRPAVVQAEVPPAGQAGLTSVAVNLFYFNYSDLNFWEGNSVNLRIFEHPLQSYTYWSNLTCSYATHGETATEGKDFSASQGSLSGSFTYYWLSISVDLYQFNPLRDWVMEDTEFLYIDFDCTLGGAYAGTHLTQRVYLYIRDLTPEPNIEAHKDLSFASEGKNFSINLSMKDATTSGDPISYSKDVSVVYQLGGTASYTGSYDDYYISSPTNCSIDGTGKLRIYFPAGQSNQTCSFYLVNDFIVERKEVITFQIISLPPRARTSNTSYLIPFLLFDKTVPGNLYINNYSNEIWESTAGGGANKIIQFCRSYWGSNIPVTIHLAYGGSATLGIDYDSLPDMITIPASEAYDDRPCANLILTARSDTVYEGDESITVTGSSPSIGTFPTNWDNTWVTIHDNSAGMIKLSASASKIYETADDGPTRSTLTATLDGWTTTVPITLNVGYSGSAARGADFGGPTQITFQPGQTSVSFNVDALSDSAVEGMETATVTLSSPSLPTLKVAPVTLEIGNTSTAGTVSISSDRGVMNENYYDTSAFVTVSLDGWTSSSDVRVDLSYSGTATRGTDFDSPLDVLIIPAGQSSASFFLDAWNDWFLESAETVTASITATSQGTPGASSATVTINDGPCDYPITISALPESITEASGSNTTTITVSLAGWTSTSPISALIGYSGTATYGTDYNSPPTSVTIPAGQSSVSFTLTAASDAIVENDETAVLTLSSPSQGTVDTAEAVVVIHNSGAAGLIKILPYENKLTEPSSDSNPVYTDLTVSLVGWTSTRPVTMAVTYGGFLNPATYGVDFIGPTSVTIPPGSSSVTFQVNIIKDTLVESYEYATVNISRPSEGLIGNDYLAVIEIANANSAGAVNISASSTDIYETTSGGTTTTTLTVWLDGWTSLSNVIVEVGIQGTALWGQDYTQIPNNTGSVVIPPGANSATLTLVANHDLVHEGNETIIPFVFHTNQGRAGTADTVTLHDTLTAGPIDINLAFNTIYEDYQHANGGDIATVSLNGWTSSSPITVNVSYGGSAFPELDYKNLYGGLLPTSVTIPPGESKTEFRIFTTTDYIVEGSELVFLAIHSPSVGTIGKGIATAQIVDNNAPGMIYLSVDPADMYENESLGVTEVTLRADLDNWASSSDISLAVNYTGTASAGSDYENPPKILLIPAGEMVGTLTLAAMDDTVYEGDKTITATISSPSEGSIADGYNAATVKLHDTPPGFISFDGTPSLAETGDGADLSPTTTLTLLLEGWTAAAPVTVNLGYSGTATYGVDYNPAPTSITIPAGESSAEITLTAKSDMLVEGNETVFIHLSNPSAGDLRSDNLNVTLLDTTSAVISLAAGPSTIYESGASGTTNTTLTASLPGSLKAGQDLTIPVAYEGTAQVGTDFSAPAQLVIPSGSSSGTLTITALGDTVVEGNETFTAQLSNPSGGTLSDTAAPFTFTLEDASQPGAVSITADPLTIYEDPSGGGKNGSLFTVSLDGWSSNSDVTVTVAYSGTAVYGTDYSSSPTTMTIPAGAPSASMPVIVYSDSLAEGNETVILTISSPSLGTINVAKKSVNLTIQGSYTANLVVDGDLPLLLTESPAVMKTVKVSLSAQPAQNVTVSLSTTQPTVSSLNKTQLVFTPENWNVAQSFTVSSVNDHSCQNFVYRINLTISSSDLVYNSTDWIEATNGQFCGFLPLIIKGGVQAPGQ